MATERSSAVTAWGTVQEKLRVLIAVTGGGSEGGAQQVVRVLLHGLPDHGIEPVLVTGSENDLTEESRGLGQRTYVLRDLIRPIRPRRDLRALNALKRVMRSEVPQIVHGHSFKAGALVRVAGSSLGIPAVYTMHGWGAYHELPYALQPLWLHLERRLSQRSMVAYVCEADRVLGDGAGISQAQVIPVSSLPRGEDRSRALAVESGEQVRILVVARFAPQKDPIGTVRTLAAVRDADPDLKWIATWIGEGPLREKTVAEARRLGVEDRILWTDAAQDIGQHYQEAHVFLLLSHYEGTPLSIIEAMRARLIIVATAVGGVEEMLTQDSGVMIPRSASTQQRAQSLLEVLRNPAAFAAMRERAGIEAARYDPAAMVQKYAEMYRRLAQAGPLELDAHASTDSRGPR